MFIAVHVADAMPRLDATPSQWLHGGEQSRGSALNFKSREARAYLELIRGHVPATTRPARIPALTHR